MGRSNKDPGVSAETRDCVAALNHQGTHELLSIVIPSHTAKPKDKPISDEDQQRWARDALALFAQLYRGATCFDTFQGVFKTEKGDILWDKPRIIESLAPVESIADPVHMERLVTFAKQLGRETKQEAVMIIIGKVAYYIEKFDAAKEP